MSCVPYLRLLEVLNWLHSYQAPEKKKNPWHLLGAPWDATPKALEIKEALFSRRGRGSGSRGRRERHHPRRLARTPAGDHRAHLDRGQRACELVPRDAGRRREPAPAGELAAGTHPLGILFFFTMARDVRGFHAPGHRALSSFPEQTLRQRRPLGHTPRPQVIRAGAPAGVTGPGHGGSDRLRRLNSSQKPRQRVNRRSAPKIPEGARSSLAGDPAGSGAASRMLLDGLDVNPRGGSVRRAVDAVVRNLAGRLVTSQSPR